jgi:hypothetical protein
LRDPRSVALALHSFEIGQPWPKHLRKELAMKQRIGIVLCAAVLLMAAGAAWAQNSGNAEGTVAYVDVVANTITFTDGRIVHFDPRSRILVNGKEVTLGEVRPGSLVVLMPAGSTMAAAPATITTSPSGTVTTVPSTAVVPGPRVPAAATVSTHPPVDLSGRVASVDPSTGLITFQDGRMVRVSGGQIWQQVPLAGIQPGSEIVVSNAVPVGYRSFPSWSERDVMSRVVSIDPSGHSMLLSDGTVVTVSPNTKMHLATGQVLTINELKPGDQIIVRVAPGAQAAVSGSPTIVTPGTTTVRTLPKTGYYARLDADQIVIIRPIQGGP